LGHLGLWTLTISSYGFPSGEGVPETPRTIRMKTRNPLAAIFAERYAHGRVIAITPVTPTMVSVRIESPAVENWDYTPGQHVRIQMNDPLSLYGILRPVETLRTYTIWDVSGADRTFELRAHLFDGE